MKQLMTITAVAAATLLWTTSSAFAGKNVKLNEVPDPVQKTITTQSQGNEQGIKIEQDTEKGRTVYNVQFQKDGKNTRLCIAEDGSILKDNRQNKGRSAEARIDSDTGSAIAEVTTSNKRADTASLPQPVQDTIRMVADLNAVEKVRQSTRDGRTVYDVELQQTGRNRRLEISSDGTVMRDNHYQARIGFRGTDRQIRESAGAEARIDRDTGTASAEVTTSNKRADTASLPQPVQDTIRMVADLNAVEKVRQSTRDGRTVYDVELQQTGRNRHLEISSDGTVMRDNHHQARIGFRGTDRQIRESAGAEVNARAKTDRDTDRNQNRTDDRDYRSGNAKKLSFNELPAPVQKTLREQGDPSTIEHINRETKDRRTVYEVEFKKEGRNTKLHVAEDGSVVKDNRQ
jgi:uncharacterized membrane protein YkoI